MSPILPRLGGTLLALACVAGPSIADRVPVHLGDPVLGGALRSFDELTGDLLPPDPALTGLRLLPIQLNGRLAAEELLPGRARWHAEPAGIGRVRLPGERGMLLRFRRDAAAGGASYGFLRVTGSGELELLGERIGSGPAGDQDPYEERVAISPDGRTALVCTRLAAGGDVLALDLESGTARDLSALLSPREWRPGSLRHGAGWLTAVSADGVWRATPGAPLEPVPLDGGPAHHTGELVLSPDGSHALTTAGSGPASLHAHAYGPVGPARRVTRDEAPLSGAGFLPEALHGPFLAVSDDGEFGAWRRLPVVAGGAHELFVRSASAAPAAPAAHVTSDAVVIDTLDEVGVLTMAQPGTLVVAVGEVAGPEDGGMGSVDLFQVDLATGAMQNMTGTSGDLSAPYEVKGQLTLVDRRTLTGGAGELVFDDPGSGEGRLLHVQPGGGLQVLAQDLKDLAFAERVGDRLVCAVRREVGPTWQVLEFAHDLTGLPTVVADLGTAEPTGWSAGPGGWFAFTAGGLLHRFQAGGGQLETFPAAVQSFGPLLGWTTSGTLVCSLTRGAVTGFAAWPTGGGAPRRLRAVVSEGTLLPAR